MLLKVLNLMRTGRGALYFTDHSIKTQNKGANPLSKAQETKIL